MLMRLLKPSGMDRVCVAHLTRHTSHVTRHTLHVTHHMSHDALAAIPPSLQLQQLLLHAVHWQRSCKVISSFIEDNLSHVTRHTSHVTRHLLQANGTNPDKPEESDSSLEDIPGFKSDATLGGTLSPLHVQDTT
jgi:hypothetical protein